MGDLAKRKAKTMKQLKDYIAYYIGCDVIIDGKERGKLMGGHFIPNSVDQIYYDIQTIEMLLNDGPDFSMPYNDDPDDPEPRVKLMLRRLEDMTEDELSTASKYDIKERVGGAWITWETPLTWHYKIKIGVDVFGLIDAGLAVDIKTIT